MPIPRTDRRDSPRFELVGPVWADIELPETARVLNTSDSGLLIEAAVCPALNSRYLTTLETNDRRRTVTTTVRHVRPTAQGRTLAGLEFVESSTPVDAAFRDPAQGVHGDPGINGESGVFEAAPGADRRRAPRLPSNDVVYVELNWSRPVRVVDISASGILLASRQLSSVGARGVLRLAFGQHRFVVAVELRRQTPYQDSSGCLLGARLLGLIDHQPGIIETLIAGEPSQRADS